MSTVFKPEIRVKISSTKKRTSSLLIGKINNSTPVVEIKLYQRLFVLFIALSTFLIFPESPKELEFLCISHNSNNVCNVF